MSARVRSYTNCLFLGFLLAVLQVLYRPAPMPTLQAVGFDWVASQGGGSFPPRTLLPALEASLVQVAMGLVVVLLVLEGLPLVLPRRLRPRAWVVGLCQFVFLLGMVVDAELALRTLAAPYRASQVMEPHAARFWTFNRSTRLPMFTINSHGLRGLEIDPDKRPGEFRILCLGNSVSAGNYLTEKQSYPFLLQAYLRKRCPGQFIRVQNGAVYGYSSSQGALVLEEIADEFKPDLVIVGFSYFELATVDSEGRPPVSHRWPFVQLRALAFDSTLYMTVRRMVLSGGDSPLEYNAPVARSADDVQRQMRVKYLQRFLEEGRKRHFQVVLYHLYNRNMVLAMDDRSGPTDPQFFDDMDLAEREHVPIIDLNRKWHQMPDIDTFMADESHPNVRGTVMQATDIGNFLLEQGLVPGGRKGGGPAGRQD